MASSKRPRGLGGTGSRLRAGRHWTNPRPSHRAQHHAFHHHIVETAEQGEAIAHHVAGMSLKRRVSPEESLKATIVSNAESDARSPGSRHCDRSAGCYKTMSGRSLALATPSKWPRFMRLAGIDQRGHDHGAVGPQPPRFAAMSRRVRWCIRQCRRAPERGAASRRPRLPVTRASPPSRASNSRPRCRR